MCGWGCDDYKRLHDFVLSSERASLSNCVLVVFTIPNTLAAHALDVYCLYLLHSVSGSGFAIHKRLIEEDTRNTAEDTRIYIWIIIQGTTFENDLGACGRDVLI
jgi:hypothetical protein